MDSRVIIRRAHSSDSDQIASLIYEWLKWKMNRKASVRESIRDGEVVVAEQKDNKKVIGIVHGSAHNDPIHGGKMLFLTTFYVKPEFRGMGMEFYC